MPDLIEKQEETEMVHTKEEADFRLLQRKAMVMQASGWFADCQSAAQAVAKALLGAEFGLDVAMSMQNVQVIKGNPSLKYIALGALVKKSGRYWWQIKPIHKMDHEGICVDAEGQPIIEGFHSDDAHCEIEFFRIERRADGTKKLIKFAEETFTIEDAAREGLASRPNYKTMPKIMLRARCISRGVNTHCSDVLGGAAYVPEDFGFSSDAAVRQVDVNDAPVEARTIKVQKKKKIAPSKKVKKKPEPKPEEHQLDDEFVRQVANDEHGSTAIVEAEFTDEGDAELNALPF
tara:strand:- start:492 stop:1361 length:870 start_codon:yes stop_codon:yes gene_type:complete